MLYLQDGGAPTYKHFDIDSATQEAERLSIKFNKDVYIMRGVCIIKPAPKTIRVELQEPIKDDDLPF